ncbi:hypothetical protein [Flammeovirga aprica]|uniref:Uncharacterized protein n=1 Tax=Flammeovirga aprica JL-4 TaxID=694437 RepID=A0A7X9P3T9_9BACT|nr:hypothetical protein [Flammeovirga aprica]NME68067.1 hypothetical protein [Flammeovirga aprica JL-4]
MKDILDIIKGATVIIGTLGVILAGVHFGIQPKANPLQEVPQTHVYTGN